MTRIEGKALVALFYMVTYAYIKLYLFGMTIKYFACIEVIQRTSKAMAAAVDPVNASRSVSRPYMQFFQPRVFFFFVFLCLFGVGVENLMTHE